MNKQWLDEFKLAFIQENIDELESLIDKLDLKTLAVNLANDSQNDKELKENIDNILLQIQALLYETINLINTKKHSKAVEIHKFEKA